MSKDAAQSFQGFPQAEIEQRDPQSIADLIDVLNADWLNQGLSEAQKPSSKPR